MTYCVFGFELCGVSVGILANPWFGLQYIHFKYCKFRLGAKIDISKQPSVALAYFVNRHINHKFNPKFGFLNAVLNVLIGSWEAFFHSPNLS